MEPDPIQGTVLVVGLWEREAIVVAGSKSRSQRAAFWEEFAAPADSSEDKATIESI